MRALSTPAPRALPLLVLGLVLGFAAAVGAVAAATPPEGAPPGPPVREIEWYTAEVPVTSQEQREREAALGRALAQVLVRVTGSVDAAADPVVQRALRNAEALLRASEYREVIEPGAAVPVPRQQLAASFDPEAVDALAIAAGLPLWQGVRPQPLLWLAIDDGGGVGPRLVAAPQVNVVRPLAQRGLERGLRLLLPAGNAVEQAAAARIWALDAAALAPLSARYAAPVQLLGRMGRAGAGWSAEWVLVEGGVERQRWRFEDGNPQRVIASGVDPMADALAAAAAIRLPAGKPETLVATVDGLRSTADWLVLAAYLQTLPVLRDHEVLEASPDGLLRLRLDLAVDRARFEALLASGGVLAVEPGAADAAPHYRLRQ